MSSPEPPNQRRRPLQNVDALDREAFDALMHGQDWFTKPVELSTHEQLVKFEPVTYLRNRWRYSNGGAYLTNSRLLYHPSAIQLDRPSRAWNLGDIETVGPLRLPWNVSWMNLLQFLPSRAWPVAVWYIHTLGKSHYFWIRRSIATDWITALSDAIAKPTGVIIDYSP